MTHFDCPGVIVPQAPTYEVRRLRRMVDVPTLEIEFDLDTAEKLEEAGKGKQAWAVYYRAPNGRRTWLVSWPNTLDGNLTAIAGLIRKHDRRHHRAYDFNLELDRSRAARLHERKRLFKDKLADITDYSASAFKAFFDGKPSIGAYGANCTGKA